eukprot:gene17937-20430_t
MLEKRPNVIEGVVIPMNLNEPNPNGIEYDNLYVDMNGLIHPCSHPEDREAPKTEEEMYINVTKYVDRLVAAVRPRRVLYLAIDGVAPRAKMNQQRSRRFRAAQEVKEKKEMMDEVIAEMVAMGYDAPEAKQGGDWDSNVITPGTEFMIKLSTYMRFYILDRMNKDPFWRNITVILSDASEPGEGEHKIMSFIRNQRSQPGFDPNQRHILHGLDADLIMLALATHEAHFTILREKVTFGKKKDEPEISEGQRLLNAQSMRNGILVSCVNPADEWVYKTPMQALHVNLLREYLDSEFSCLKYSLPFGYDLERVIDDFIFLCFFVGNDFLPHLPSLDIRDGALDFLMECYKELLPSMGDYITSPGGNINLQQADVILGHVGEIEDQIFIQRKRAADNEERRRLERFGGRNTTGNNTATGGYGASTQRNNQNGNGQQTQQYQQQLQQHVHPSRQANIAVGGGAPVAPVLSQSEQNKAAANALKQSLLGKRPAAVLAPSVEDAPVAVNGVEETPPSATTTTSETAADTAVVSMADDAVEGSGTSVVADEENDMEEEETPLIPIPLTVVPKSKSMTPAEIERAKEELKKRIKDKEQAILDKNRETVVDAVKLHEAGWKDRYYEEPYKKENIEKNGGLKRMAYTYVQGLCWVMKYYYQGVPSWNWYYPFHYAPFASDLRNIDSYGEIEFELSEPFRPIEQLLAVFPANSVKALPEPCHWLMTDPKSPIFDLYDSDIPIDPNGKHLPWLWILLLPFVDETRITAAFELCREKFSLHDAKRNKFGLPVVFVHKDHPLAAFASQNIRYLPGPETDVEVLRALKDTNAKMGAQFDTENDTTTTDGVQNGTPAAAETCSFDAHVSNGMSGILTQPPPSFYAPLHTVVKAPVDQTNGFRDVGDNKVMCFTYTLLPMPTIHQSVLLPGVVPQPSTLTQFDLMPRRPPRLNKGGFNITDIFQNMKDKEQNQRGGGYNQPQYNAYGYQSNSGGNRYNQNQNQQYGFNQNHQGQGRGQGQGQGYNNYGGQDQYQHGRQQGGYQGGHQQHGGYQQQGYQQQGYQQQRYPDQGRPQCNNYPPQQQRGAPSHYDNRDSRDSRYSAPPVHQQYGGYQQPPPFQNPLAYQPPSAYGIGVPPPLFTAPPARPPAAPIEHTVSTLKDKDTQRAAHYGSHRVDRTVPIGAYNRGASGGAGRQAIFLDTMPVQPPVQPAGRYKHSAAAASAPAVPHRSASGMAPQPTPRQSGHSFGPPARTAPLGPAGLSGVPPASGNADSMQSIRDQLLKTLQQNQR